MANVLVIRTSSLGDVALLVPVVYSVAARYPRTRFAVMTRQAYAPLFFHLGFNVTVVPLDMRKKHRGIFGLFRMTCKGLFGGYTHVADTHDVLRTKILRTIMRIVFAKVAKIDKGRAEKAEMIASKKTEPFLPHVTQRYFDVFEKLGFPATMIFNDLYDFKPRVFSYLNTVIKQKSGTWIGIAPFAQHQGKIYPLEKMEKVVEKLSQRKNTSLFLFGAGKKELSVIKEWADRYPNIISHHGLLNFDREILLISYLDLMISMDSANMHLASLVSVPVVSIWGATHPAMGFYGIKQPLDNAVQLNVDCRPCSVYGNIPCAFSNDDEYKCLKEIAEQDIIQKVDDVLVKVGKIKCE